MLFTKSTSILPLFSVTSFTKYQLVLTEDRCVVINDGPDLHPPAFEDEGVVDVVVQALPDVESLLRRGPHLASKKSNSV